MSFFDSLKNSLARQAAQQTANQAKDTAVRAVESLAEDFLEAAEGALQQAQAERWLQAESAETSEPAEEQTRSLHEERMDRKRRAAEELAKLKALRDAKDD